MFPKRLCNEELQFFFKMKLGYKTSCVKILMCSEITRRLVFIRNIADLIHRENK